jgi:hypothetical protein
MHVCMYMCIMHVYVYVPGEKTIKEIATVCPKGSEIVTLNGKPEM